MPAIRLLASFEKNIPEQQLYHSLHEPFDLEHELLVRWYIIEQPSSTLLYLVSHHIALDGGGLTQLSGELFDVLAGNSHSPSQLSQSFSQAHLAEVGIIQDYQADKSSPKSSSENGDSRKHIRTLKRHVSTSSWELSHSDGQRHRSMDLMIFAVFILLCHFPKMFVHIQANPFSVSLAPLLTLGPGTAMSEFPLLDVMVQGFCLAGGTVTPYPYRSHA